ncbi:MAG: glycerophosphodiester phosphodiesterase [Thermomicrobiales bacterium]
MQLQVQTIAHRGASGYAPENTRAAFDRAIDMGSAAIETDVRMIRDGRLVLFHDGTVDRTSDGSGPVDDFTLEELRRLDLGGWFAAEFAGERVLTVEEAIDEYVPRIPFVFEIKDGRATRRLIELLRERRMLDRVQITSFLWYPLLDARALDGDVNLGFLTPSFETNLVERIVERGINQICPHVSQLSRRRVDIARAHGLTVRAWGIDQRVQVERLFESGADGATINWPDWMQSEAPVSGETDT